MPTDSWAKFWNTKKLENNLQISPRKSLSKSTQTNVKRKKKNKMLIKYQTILPRVTAPDLKERLNDTTIMDSKLVTGAFSGRVTMEVTD